MAENVVEIPEGSGNKYRYEYVDGDTVYKGPVGSAPEIGETEFLDIIIGREHKKEKFNKYFFKSDILINAEQMKGITDYLDEKNDIKLTNLLHEGKAGVISGMTDEDEQWEEIIGKIEMWPSPGKPTEKHWRDGSLVTALKEGKTLVIKNYEDMTPEIQRTIRQIAKDDGIIVNGKWVKRHKKFNMVAEMSLQMSTIPSFDTEAFDWVIDFT